MLVLTRRMFQSVLIGDVRVTVVDIRKGAVRLGIEAPKEMPVDRSEVREQKAAKVVSDGKA